MFFCANAATFGPGLEEEPDFTIPIPNREMARISSGNLSGRPARDASPPGDPCEWVPPVNKQIPMPIAKTRTDMGDPFDVQVVRAT